MDLVPIWKVLRLTQLYICCGLHSLEMYPNSPHSSSVADAGRGACRILVWLSATQAAACSRTSRAKPSTKPHSSLLPRALSGSAP
eukprot:scaffold631_cov378-Prasinococcus_capsulatus_cf.AAC.22